MLDGACYNSNMLNLKSMAFVDGIATISYYANQKLHEVKINKNITKAIKTILKLPDLDRAYVSGLAFPLFSFEYSTLDKLKYYYNIFNKIIINSGAKSDEPGYSIKSNVLKMLADNFIIIPGKFKKFAQEIFESMTYRSHDDLRNMEKIRQALASEIKLPKNLNNALLSTQKKYGDMQIVFTLERNGESQIYAGQKKVKVKRFSICNWLKEYFHMYPEIEIIEGHTIPGTKTVQFDKPQNLKRIGSLFLL